MLLLAVVESAGGTACAATWATK